MQAYCSVDRDGTITQGGYSTHVVVDQDYVLRAPDSLDFSKVAPCCAPASPPTPPYVTGRPGRTRRWRWSAWEDSATSPSSSPTPWVRT
jgi:hypothetical protein